MLPEYQAQISQQARKQGQTSDISRVFSKYDVVETSYHFLSQRIDLHLCDDPGGTVLHLIDCFLVFNYFRPFFLSLNFCNM